MNLGLVFLVFNNMSKGELSAVLAIATVLTVFILSFILLLPKPCSEYQLQEREVFISGVGYAIVKKKVCISRKEIT